MRSSLLSSTPESSFEDCVFGIDEAGRGCLAGPVVAACVAFDWVKIDAIQALDAAVTIRDSKLMTRAQRREASVAIREVAVAWGVGVVDVEMIDEINILQATFEAMRRAVGMCRDTDRTDGDGYDGCEQVRFLVDGNKKVPGVDWEQEAIIDGDAKVFSIAAASILAKEHRDSFMDALHVQYPDYAFDRHKGYGTKAHYEAIAKYGVTPFHRKTFLKHFFAQGQCL